MNEYLIRWQPSPLPGRLLAFVFAPNDSSPDGLDPCGVLTFSDAQALEVHESWPGSQQGWPE